MEETQNENADPFKPDVPESDPRVQMAAERTLLAWIRTGLALMAFGFVVARFALIMQTIGLKTSLFFTMKATIIGVMMVMLGVVASAGAPWHYHGYFKRIEIPGQRPFAAWSLVMFVAYATSLIGVVLAIYLLIVDISNWNVAGTIQR